MTPAAYLLLLLHAAIQANCVLLVLPIRLVAEAVFSWFASRLLNCIFDWLRTRRRILPRPMWLRSETTSHMATLTLKGIPDDVLARLKERAASERRSLNQHAIYVLERAADAQPQASRAAFDAFWQRRADISQDGPDAFRPERDRSVGREAPSFE